MKLYIESDFVKVGKVENDDEFDDSILKKFAVQYNVKHLDNSYIELTIYEQKICLNEINMNTLFDNIINCFDYTMEYGWYGGEGCEFSISIKTMD